MAQPEIPAGTWQLDPSHSSVNFSVRHLMVSKVRGRFTSFTGTITVAPELTGSSVEAAIDLASVDTNDAGRDEHLRSPDFFDTAAHPEMTFRSTSLDRRGDDWRLAGELTIKGVTKPVTLDVEFGGVAGDPWGNTRLGLEAHGSLNRKDFGMGWNAALETGGVVVGDKVNLDLEVEAVLQTAPVSV